MLSLIMWTMSKAIIKSLNREITDVKKIAEPTLFDTCLIHLRKNMWLNYV